ncbi:MAG: efflux RND transporter periplasmic adaptor subunit, partial [Coxiellaceae bacterium]|nr:efflux RND transporter periplasmic adaptor subunit [Coxiellaceae bacterium]
KGISMAKRFSLAIIILLIIFGGTFAWYVLRVILTKRFFATHQEPAVVVSTTIAKKETWHPNLKSVGTVQAINGVEVNAEVTGHVTKIYFKSGQFVKKGDPLVQLDDSVDIQTLNNNLAALRLDTLNYHRQKRLYKTGSTSKADLDSAQAKMLQSKSQVVSARVEIEKKNVKAPFDGKLGIREVNLGQYVTAGQSMVLLQSLNPLFVNFTLPEQFLEDIKVGQLVQISIDSQKGATFDGKITAINSSVDATTRTISVQATFPNDDNKLYPGLFADVNVIMPEQVGVVTVPQTSITYSLYGDSIYVVNNGKDKFDKSTLIAEQKFVKVGERRGTVIAVKKGVNAGDQIVTAGQLKLHPGSRIKINNAIKVN